MFFLGDPAFWPHLKIDLAQNQRISNPPPKKKIAFKLNRYGNYSLKSKFIDLCICMYVCVCVFFFFFFFFLFLFCFFK